jgi:hypothetical protein
MLHLGVGLADPKTAGDGWAQFSGFASWEAENARYNQLMPPTDLKGK